MNLALKRNSKSGASIKLLGCSIEYFRQYMEAQFEEGMEWDNLGEWHIDHRRPCSSFDLNKPEEQRMCFHYTNLQPLWAAENIGKSDNFDISTFNRVWDGDKWVDSAS